MKPDDLKPDEAEDSLEKIVSELKHYNPKPREYLAKHGEEGFFFSSKDVQKKYEAIILREATKVMQKTEAEKQEKAKTAERLKTETLNREKARARYESFLESIVTKIRGYPADVDYITLSAEDRKLFEDTFKKIEKKPLDDWSEAEKILFRFWRKLPRIEVERIAPFKLAKRRRVAVNAGETSISRRSGWADLCIVNGVICLLLAFYGTISFFDKKSDYAFYLAVVSTVGAANSFFFAFLVNVFTDIRWFLMEIRDNQPLEDE
jgi:hypothetical protein